MEEVIQWLIIFYLVYQVRALTTAVKLLLLNKKRTGVPKMEYPPKPPKKQNN